MNERDLQLVMRAKRQIDREVSLRSFLWVGLVFCAVLRMLGIVAPLPYILLFVILFVSLVLNSEVIASFGRVSKTDLVNLIEKHIHNDPKVLARYAGVKSKS
ncbi:MAG: hypothetical protein QGG54_09400 [Gammaproteobacteria bacterium]|nr:hypothetical protein [Gammaproteobacteria bacterium]MDP6651076.1 hypothetical protein [Gammaproteobacteria bacterium]HAJ75313.1 hypothetical protein [Gammaproteobacteria bacterium]